jgi:acetyl esterase/lipase
MIDQSRNLSPGIACRRGLARHSFACGRLATALLASLTSAAFVLPCYADQREFRHEHVGGALSHRPHTFTMQVWYRDIPYDKSADDDQHTSLDIYTADPVEAGSPVMVFVHGGGFRVGDKASSKDLDPKPEYFTSKLGYVLISTNYRLLPEGRYPRNVQDVANALAWVSDNIGRFGGDPERIFLMGHSAGASLVAQVATDETFLKNAGKDLGLLKGVIANEGSYGVESDEREAQRQEELLGTNWRNVVPVARVASGKNIPPFLLFHVTGGETLVSNSEEQAIGMGSALRSAGVRADVVSLNHVEHFGANERIGEPGDITTVEVERFLDSITGRQTPAQWTSARPLGAGR